MAELAGRIVTPEGVVEGTIRFTGRVERVTPAPVAGADRNFWILPGFIDLHVHGGGGYDAMRGEVEVRGLAAFHARHGTTTLLPTTVTAPHEDLVAAATGIGLAHARPGHAEARVLGLHLEGPFISEHRLGAQPPFARPPDTRQFDELRALAPIRVLTMAPEIDAGLAFLRHATAAGTVVQIGHTDGTYEDAVAALDAGARGFTHLFNAMRPFAHRAPGIVGAALAHADFAELIPDLLHVAPAGLLAARRAIPGLYGVTDAISATGMPDGAHWLGRHEVTKRGNEVQLADGTIAGSVLTMDRALRNLVGLGLSVPEAAARLATLPADHLGLTDRGRLAVGEVADILVLDEDLRLRRVFCGGEAVDVDDAG